MKKILSAFVIKILLLNFVSAALVTDSISPPMKIWGFLKNSGAATTGEIAFFESDAGQIGAKISAGADGKFNKNGALGGDVLLPQFDGRIKIKVNDAEILPEQIDDSMAKEGCPTKNSNDENNKITADGIPYFGDACQYNIDLAGVQITKIIGGDISGEDGDAANYSDTGLISIEDTIENIKNLLNNFGDEISSISGANAILTKKKILFESFGTGLQKPVIFVPTNRSTAASQKIFVVLPTGLNFEEGIEIFPPEEISSRPSVSNVNFTKTISVPTSKNGSLNFSAGKAEICIDKTNLGSNANDIRIYYQNSGGSWLNDSTASDKIFRANLFCFKATHFTNFSVGKYSAPSSSPGGSPPIYNPGNGNTTNNYYSPGGGGGGGGGGGSSTVLPIKLSTSVIGTSDYTRPIDFSVTKGLIPRVIRMISSKATVEFKKSTRITFADDSEFRGILNLPTAISSKNVPIFQDELKDFKKISIFKFGEKTDKKLKFSKNYKLIVPLSILSQQYENIKIYFYNTETKKYELVGDGGQIADDRKTISVDLDHATIFAVLTDGKKRTTTFTPVKPIPVLTDLVEGKWYFEYVQKLLNRRVVEGYPDKTYRPNENLNRAEISKMVTLNFEINVPNAATTAPFLDVPADKWFAKYVEVCKNLGIATGQNFRPAENVTRAEMVKMVVIAGAFEIQNSGENFPDVPENSEFAPYILTAKNLGIISGYDDGTFGPNKNLNRAEMAKILVIAKNLQQ